MEATDPHATYNYSHDQILKSAFEMELQTLKIKDEVVNGDMVASYLSERIREIKERWQ
jgi:hypothetical protein